MYFKNLKTSIAGNFALVLGVGMILVNIVAFALWQNHTIATSRHHAEKLLSLVALSGLKCGVAETVVAQWNVEEQESGITFFIWSKEDGLYPLAKRSETMENALRLTSITGQPMVQTEGKFWSWFGLQPLTVSFVQQVDYCGESGAIAARVSIHSVYERILDKQAVIFVYILVNLIILTTIGFFRMRKLVVAPLEKLVRQSQTFVEAGDDFFPSASHKNEFGHVANALHNMLTRIESDKKQLASTVNSLEKANKEILDNQKKLIETEKLVAIGRLAAGLAHEIGNPLGIVQGYLELLGQTGLQPEDKKEYSTRAIKELDRVSLLLRQLLDMSRKNRAQSGACRVYPIAENLVAMVSQQKECCDVTFNVQCRSQGMVLIGEADLHQVLLNCILNAVDGIEESKRDKGTISLTCRDLDEGDRHFCEIVLRDDGSGVSEDRMGSVFEPFFSTKEVGRGTGLGLAVSKSLIEQSGGTIALTSDGVSFTQVRIVLPVTTKGMVENEE